MRKLQEQDSAFKGEITAFSALIFILMLSIVGALVESAFIQMKRSTKRAVTRLALESVFAEYHVEMLKQYDLFVHVGGTEDVIRNRLQYYGARGMAHALEQVELLSDYGGKPFFEQAVAYEKDWLGMDDLSSVGNLPFFTGENAEEQEKSILQRIEEALEEKDASLPKENNPLQSVQNLKNRGLLTLVLTDATAVSNQTLNTKDLPSMRELTTGNYGEPHGFGAVDKLFFVAYLTEHFSNMAHCDEKKALFYEQEYLIGGKASDRENLEQVCKKILQMRTASNYAYLLTDAKKQGEAEAVATVICSAVGFPELIGLVKQGLLLGWAYGEGVVDVRVLLKGKKVPLMKTAESWQLQLSNLIKLGTPDESVDEKDIRQGFGYDDYLKCLLVLENQETLCMRGLDLIESNVHIKIDQCMTKAQIKTSLQLHGVIRDEFDTKFGYL